MQPPIPQDNTEDLNLLQRQEGNDALKSIENTSEMALMQREEANSKLDDINRTLELQLEQNNGVQKVEFVQTEVEDDEDKLANTFYKMLRGKKGEKGDKGDKGDQGIPGEKGEPGEDAYQPIKGRDYDDGKDGYTPIKGVDYFDGKDSDPVEVANVLKADEEFKLSVKGEKGDTPVLDTTKIINDVAKKVLVKPEKLIEQLKDKISYNDLKDKPEFFKQSSKTVSLKELDDVDLSNATITNGKYVIPSNSGGGGSLTLQTDGTPNGSQTLLNLVGGTNVTLTDNGTGTVTIDATGGSGSGDVTGPASSTDNALVRFDGTTGKVIQNSTATLDDAGILSVASAIVSGTNGSGHINLRHQASDASATGQSTAIFADSNGDFKYKNDGNFYTTLKTSTNTADRTYTYPDATGNLALKGTLAANQIAYATDTNTIASLDTATYPSLTELSYVKGVTSSIQTQLNAKGTGSVTSVDVSGGTTGLTFTGGPVTTSGTITAAGTLAVANGGTGQTSYTNGQLLIGNTTGNTLTKATLTGTANQVVVTNGGGSITLSTPQDIATTSNPQFATIELGNASDTTLSRSAAGTLAVEGVDVLTTSNTKTVTNKTIQAPLIDYVIEPTSDDTYEGEATNDINAGDTIAQWDLVYLDSTSGRWEFADADAASTSGGVLLALAAASGTDGNPMNVVFRGVVRNDGWTWSGAGKALYVSTTAGGMTETAPSGASDVIRVVGYTLSDDAIYFNPDNAWVVHT